MRRLVILLIVSIIAFLIVYGIYKWGTSGKTETSSQAQKTTPSVSEVKKTEEKTPKQVAPSPIDRDITKPFKYDKTVWGDLTAIPLSNEAKTGLLVDLNTREVLWAKEPKKSVPIASMTKMMTLLLIMEGLQKNSQISLDTMVQVTREASLIGGSQAWLDPREQFSIRDLLKTIVVHSANDSSYLLAQYFGGGDAQTFVNMMNQRAKELKLGDAFFSNPDGLPEKNSANENRATAEDMAFLSEKLLNYQLITEFAQLKSMVFRPESEKPITFVNTNKLIRWDVKGVNGMKTGYTKVAGFCTTVTCTRDGKTLIAVATGFKTSKDRDNFMRQLLDWGYNPNRLIQTVASTAKMTDSSNPSVTSAPKGPISFTETYKVQKGESLWSISKKFNISVTELTKANNISVNTPIRIGQVLKVPPLPLTE